MYCNVVQYSCMCWCCVTVQSAVVTTSLGRASWHPTCAACAQLPLLPLLRWVRLRVTALCGSRCAEKRIPGQESGALGMCIPCRLEFEKAPVQSTLSSSTALCLMLRHVRPLCQDWLQWGSANWEPRIACCQQVSDTCCAFTQVRCFVCTPQYAMWLCC
jgi:hypothetical protein